MGAHASSLSRTHAKTHLFSNLHRRHGTCRRSVCAYIYAWLPHHRGPICIDTTRRDMEACSCNSRPSREMASTSATDANRHSGHLRACGVYRRSMETPIVSPCLISSKHAHIASFISHAPQAHVAATAMYIYARRVSCAHAICGPTPWHFVLTLARGIAACGP